MIEYELDVEHYKHHQLSNLEEVRKHYRKLPNIKTAIEQACQGQIPCNKKSETIMDSHQYYIGYETCKKGMLMLLALEHEIKSCRSFECLFTTVEQVANRITGLGPLWAYDTALRIGFKKDLLPEQVYVQRGVAKGVRKALNVTRCPKGRSLPVSKFPLWLTATLEAYQIENFLCIWGKHNYQRNDKPDRKTC